MIKYTPVSTLYFDQNKSNGSEFDYVTFLSLLDLGIAATEKNEIDAVRCLCLAGLDLSITNKVCIPT